MKLLSEVSFADGQIRSVESTSSSALVEFIDWQGRAWRLSFHEVIAIENLNIEDEDVSHWKRSEDNLYLEEVAGRLNEPRQGLSAFQFFTAWDDSPRLTIIARSAEAVLLH